MVTILKSPNDFGNRIFFSPVDKNAPATIHMAGITNPRSDYSVVIDSRIHSIEYYQFEYVTKGKGYIEVDDSVTAVSEGDFFLIKKNVPRKIYSDKKQPFKKIYVSAKGPFIDAMVKSYGFDNDITVVKADVKSYFDTIMKKIGEAKEQTPGLGNFIVGELLKIIQEAYLCRFPNESHNSHKVAYEIAEYISDNLHRHITLSELCDKFYLGETQLIKIFKKKYNDTPMNYVQKMRISHAKHYLLNTDFEIAKIAEMTGFSDCGYFAKVFRKYFGITPLAGRKHREKITNLIFENVVQKNTDSR